MSLEYTEKQGYEEYTIIADFYKVLGTGETLVLGSCSVSAVDNAGIDATATVLDATALSVVASPTSGAASAALQVLVKGGTEAGSKYKITFKATSNSTPAHKWELDLSLKIKEK